MNYIHFAPSCLHYSIRLRSVFSAPNAFDWVRPNQYCNRMGIGYFNAVAQWIRPWTLNREVPGSNLQAAAVVPLGKALYPHCLVPRKGLKAVGPLVACL